MHTLPAGARAVMLEVIGKMRQLAEELEGIAESSTES